MLVLRLPADQHSIASQYTGSTNIQLTDNTSNTMNTHFLSFKNYPLNRTLIHGACVKGRLPGPDQKPKKRMGSYCNFMIDMLNTLGRHK